mmetsp:Transcript_31228/g.52215  ORF Transcript_31228/g.52215 Transcript_31228/m.52215 type:complete len:306 (-) Transcript_31228:250-1167(-)
MIIPQAIKAWKSPTGHFDGVAIHKDKTNVTLDRVNTQTIFYTDADIVFTGNINHVLKDYKNPEYLAFPIQGDRMVDKDFVISRTAINAGVMLMNTAGYASKFQEFEPFVLKHVEAGLRRNVWVGSQGPLTKFFPIKLNWGEFIYALPTQLRRPSQLRSQFNIISNAHSDLLPKTLEWEPYLGYNPDAVLLHWHGPKIGKINCDSDSIENDLKSGPNSMLHWYTSQPDSETEKRIIQAHPLLGFAKRIHPTNEKTREGYEYAGRLFNEYRDEVCGKRMEPQIILTPPEPEIIAATALASPSDSNLT